MIAIHGGISLRSLLLHHPWAEEVLGWHRIDARAIDANLSVEAACWLLGRDPHRLLADLWAATSEHVPRSWREAPSPAAHDDEVPPADASAEDFWEGYADDLVARIV